MQMLCEPSDLLPLCSLLPLILLCRWALVCWQKVFDLKHFTYNSCCLICSVFPMFTGFILDFQHLQVLIFNLLFFSFSLILWVVNLYLSAVAHYNLLGMRNSQAKAKSEWWGEIISAVDGLIFAGTNCNHDNGVKQVILKYTLNIYPQFIDCRKNWELSNMQCSWSYSFSLISEEKIVLNIWINSHDSLTWCNFINVFNVTNWCMSTIVCFSYNSNNDQSPAVDEPYSSRSSYKENR